MQLQDKYESDLSRKEKWQLECQKIKNMTFNKKVEYLWTYYKVVLLIFAAVLLIVYTGITIMENSSKNPVLSIVIADAEAKKEPEIIEWGNELLFVLNANEPGDIVAIDTTVSSKEDEASIINAVIALSGELEDNDVVICGEEIYQKFAAENAFLDITEVLDEKECKELPIENGVLVLDDCKKWNSLEFTAYQHGYLCVLKKAPNTENISRLVEYFWEL